MKKISLLLALVTLLSVILAGFSIQISAASPLDDFTAVSRPADSTIRKTSTRYWRVWGVENPVGTWDPWAYADGGMGEGSSMYEMMNTATYVDCNNSAIVLCYNDYDPHTLTELVFADGFTASGQGDWGKTRIRASVWDKITVVVSDDGLNWREVGYTVAYHTEPVVNWTGTHQKTYTIDLFWHLILEETTTAKYFAIHANEPKAWDAPDHSPRLGIILATDFYYGVNASGYEADLGDIRFLHLRNELVAGNFLDVSFEEDGTLYYDGMQKKTGEFNAWTNSGKVKSFPYVGYQTPVSINELIIGDLTGWSPETPMFTDYSDLEIYYTDDINGVWNKMDCTVVPYDCNHELNGTYIQGIRFIAKELITAQYFMIYDADPAKNELWLAGSTFTAVYDPANGTAAPETTVAPETSAPETTAAPETSASETTAAPESSEVVTTETVTTEAVTTAAEETAPETSTTDGEKDPAAEPWIYVVIAAAAVVVIVVIVIVSKKRKA